MCQCPLSLPCYDFISFLGPFHNFAIFIALNAHNSIILSYTVHIEDMVVNAFVEEMLRMKKKVDQEMEKMEKAMETDRLSVVERIGEGSFCSLLIKCYTSCTIKIDIIYSNLKRMFLKSTAKYQNSVNSIFVQLSLSPFTFSLCSSTLTIFFKYSLTLFTCPCKHLCRIISITNSPSSSELWCSIIYSIILQML